MIIYKLILVPAGGARGFLPDLQDNPVLSRYLKAWIGRNLLVDFVTPPPYTEDDLNGGYFPLSAAGRAGRMTKGSPDFQLPGDP